MKLLTKKGEKKEKKNHSADVHAFNVKLVDVFLVPFIHWPDFVFGNSTPGVF